MLKVTLEVDTDYVPKLKSPFELSDADLNSLRYNALKSEEIAGDPGTRHARVHELLHWFVRLAAGLANPKWAVSHAYELAYYIATTDMNAGIDISNVKQEAFLRGVNITPEERTLLVRIGVINGPENEQAKA